MALPLLGTEPFRSFAETKPWSYPEGESLGIVLQYPTAEDGYAYTAARVVRGTRARPGQSASWSRPRSTTRASSLELPTGPWRTPTCARWTTR